MWDEDGNWFYDGTGDTSTGTVSTSDGSGDNSWLSDGWTQNSDGTVTDRETGNIWNLDGTYMGNTDDASQGGGQGGGNVVFDPDQFGDVYSVNGNWVGNIYGLADPAAAPLSGRSAGNTPGAAYSGSGFSGGSSGGSGSGSQSGQPSLDQIIAKLAQMLTTAKAAGPSTAQQQLALSAALRNAQAQASSSSGSGFLVVAGVALLGIIRTLPAEKRRVNFPK